MERLPLRERNKQRVTQRIIAVALELFKAKGYNQTTMDDIAEQAEISRKCSAVVFLEEIRPEIR